MTEQVIQIILKTLDRIDQRVEKIDDKVDLHAEKLIMIDAKLDQYVKKDDCNEIRETATNAILNLFGTKSGKVILAVLAAAAAGLGSYFGIVM